MTGSSRRAQSKRSGSAVLVPEFIPPCLAKLAQEPPDGANWVHEIKFDGYRLQARLAGGRVELRTRTGLDWTDRFSNLAAAFATLTTSSAIIDGEAVVEDETGVSNFSALVADLKAGRSRRIVFVAFDLLHLDGVSLIEQPLGARKLALSYLIERLGPAGAIRFSQHMDSHGASMLAEACRLGLEGIVSKRIDLPYRSGRHSAWLKIKCVQTDEFVVAGYLESTALRDAVGALVAAYYSRGELVYAGRVGTGFTRQAAKALWQALQPLRTAKFSFSATLDANQRRGVVWVDPVLVAQIEYRGFTGDRLLRHAAFKALRDDKKATDVKFPTASD
jgi:bifunctional non-homologous end joining protein LigD